MMRGLRPGFLALLVLAAVSPAYAQGTLAGVVRDGTGAVLPGVTVEAASPVLIEKARTTVTDGSGQYRVIDLRPGSYRITYTLAGFTTVVRDGVELTGNAVVTANVEMRVSGVAETITVSGEAPVVDIQSTTRQQVLSKEDIDVLPTGRNYTSLGFLLPGVNVSLRDVGGASGDTMAQLTIHGSRASDQRIMQNGVNTMTLQTNGDQGIAVANPGMASEVTIDLASVSAEYGQGGVRINYIPRDGGNRFSGSTFLTFASESTQAENLTDDLRTRGLPTPNAIKQNYDFNPSLGGPLKRDRLWFFFTGRVMRADQYPGGSFVDLNGFNPNAYNVDFGATPRRAYSQSLWQDAQIRLTAQATPRNKVAFTWDQQTRCSCLTGPGSQGWGVMSATVTPEAATNMRSPTQRLLHFEWSSPATNNLLLEGAGVYRTERWAFSPPNPEWSPDFITPAEEAVRNSGALIPVLDLSNGRFSHGNFIGYNDHWVANAFVRASASYLVRGHQLKAGFSNSFGYLDARQYDFSPYSFFINLPGAPPFIRIINQKATPLTAISDQDYDLGIFVQDRWTAGRATMNLGLRYDAFKATAPAQVLRGQTPLTPLRGDIAFPETPLAHWQDVTPRFGLTYDLTGDGKTALKVSVNKYVEGMAVGSLVGLTAGGNGPHPVSSLVNSTSRIWQDLNFDFVPQCDLTNLGANGECQAVSNPGFGSNNTNALRFDPDALFGWGRRGYNWEFGGGIQHQLVSRVSLDVGYYHRTYGNFRITDNLELGPTEFTRFQVIAPTVAGLSTSGNTLTAFDANRVATPRNFTTRASNYGEQVENWRGVDVSVNARTAMGLRLFGGVSTGKTIFDNCDIVSQVPEVLGTRPLEYCHAESPFVTQLKLNAAYTIPRADVLLSAAMQSVAGPVTQATFAVTQRAPGVPLVGATNVNVALLPTVTQGSGAEYGDRLNQLDLRVGKILRAGRTRTMISADIFNLFNGNAVTNENPAVTAFRRPTQIMLARFFKLSAQIDF